MIFVTVGGQTPFDRLIRAVDEWAGEGAHEAHAQIGQGTYQPQHMAWSAFLDPQTFRRRVEDADLVVAHAGMGTIISTLLSRTPLLVMPRRGDLHETRNDHQLATARLFAQRGYLTVAWDERDLQRQLCAFSGTAIPPRISDHASEDLLEALHTFIERGTLPEMHVHDATR